MMLNNLAESNEKLVITDCCSVTVQDENTINIVDSASNEVILSILIEGSTNKKYGLSIQTPCEKDSEENQCGHIDFDI